MRLTLFFLFILLASSCQNAPSQENNTTAEPTLEEPSPPKTDSETMPQQAEMDDQEPSPDLATDTDTEGAKEEKEVEVAKPKIEPKVAKQEKVKEPEIQQEEKKKEVQKVPKSELSNSESEKKVEENLEQEPITPPAIPEEGLEQPTPPPFTHNIWDILLRRHVSRTGKVNYAGFKTDRTELDAYLNLLADNVPGPNQSRNEHKAYWINAYNAFTIDLILDNYPLSSILKLDNGNTWDVKRIELGGQKYSLNQIEKDILLKGYQDGRIHFAVNCAAKSCPPLRNRAWKAATLNSDLERFTKAFINNSEFNQIDKKKVQLSKIFEWYTADFGDLNSYINKYSDVQINEKAKIQFNEYDWALNN